MANAFLLSIGAIQITGLLLLLLQVKLTRQYWSTHRKVVVMRKSRIEVKTIVGYLMAH